MMSVISWAIAMEISLIDEICIFSVLPINGLILLLLHHMYLSLLLEFTLEKRELCCQIINSIVSDKCHSSCWMPLHRPLIAVGIHLLNNPRHLLHISVYKETSSSSSYNDPSIRR